MIQHIPYIPPSPQEKWESYNHCINLILTSRKYFFSIPPEMLFDICRLSQEHITFHLDKTYPSLGNAFRNLNRLYPSNEIINYIKGRTLVHSRFCNFIVDCYFYYYLLLFHPPIFYKDEGHGTIAILQNHTNYGLTTISVNDDFPRFQLKHREIFFLSHVKYNPDRVSTIDALRSSHEYLSFEDSIALMPMITELIEAYQRSPYARLYP